MGDWKCKECGYNVKADTPPEKCPSCDKKCELLIPHAIFLTVEIPVQIQGCSHLWDQA